MSGAGYTRVVVADGLLALPGKLFLGEIQILANEMPKILFNRFQILGCWGNDFGVKDISMLIEAIAVVEDPPRRLGATVADAVARRTVHV